MRRFPLPRCASGPTRNRRSAPAHRPRAILDRLAPGIDDATHPRDGYEGRKPALVLGIRLSAAPRVVLPTSPPAASPTCPASRRLAGPAALTTFRRAARKARFQERVRSGPPREPV
ncbi:hypothetical protein [Streptomyces vinaceus]|uniref:hypothetical protein n=1 Tax=Streptomyces vinaceus TaxID=1960 RepID=UPI0037F53FFB